MVTMTGDVWRRLPAARSASVTQRPPWGVVAAMAAVILGCAGCQSSQEREEKARCPLAAGMTTEELARCGCFSTRSQSGYAVGLTQEDTKQAAETVDIVGYLCPRGSAGFARVIVFNGIAKDIYE